MKDAANRFDLESFRAKNTSRSENNPTIIYLFSFGTLIFILLIIPSLTSAQKTKIEQKLLTEDAKQKERKIYESESDKSKQQIIEEMRKNQELKKMMSQEFVAPVFKHREDRKKEEIGKDFVSV